VAKPFPSIRFKITLIIENYSSNAPTSEAAFLPERASNFEPLKEFRAAQNTTCHLLSANTFSLIDCLKIYRSELINESEKLVLAFNLSESCM
jgi:hypothetical protein